MKLLPKIVLVSFASILLPVSAFASEASEKIESTTWTWPGFIVVPLALSGILYAIGAVRMCRSAGLRRAPVWNFASFAAGWLCLIIALDSPLHELSEQLFWVHMTQHEVLMLICAPLLVLGRPLAPFVWALPSAWRATVGAALRISPVLSIWRKISTPMAAWILHALALWVWHIPALFDATLHSEWVHAAQHLSFLGTALIFWWALVYETRAEHSYGASVLYTFTTAVHTSILGALLTFAANPWYRPYFATAPNFHVSPLEDQQLGGLIMWVPAGTILLAVTLILFWKWMAASEQRWALTRTAAIFRNSQGARSNAN